MVEFRVPIIVTAAVLALAGCGRHFPAGEHLWPGSYGPPYGAALERARPHHPHNPAHREREAQADAARNRIYGSYVDCRAALERALAPHSGSVVAISASEAVGHFADAQVVHEYRCAGPVLSYRAWHRGGEAGAEHGPSESDDHHGG